VMITAPQYFVLCLLAVVGLVLIFYGGRNRHTCGFFDFVCFQINASETMPGRITTLFLGACLLLGLVVSMCMRYRAAQNLQYRLQATMKQTEILWQTMISPLHQHCSIFVRARLVSNHDSLENNSKLASRISQVAVIVASDFYMASASRSHDSSRNVSRLKMRIIAGQSCVSTISLLVKSNLSLKDVQKSIESAGYGMYVIAHYEIPSSLASLVMLCERIEEDLMAQRMHATQVRQKVWRRFNRVHTHKPVDRYTRSGKRLKREENIDLLFQQSQLINSLFDDELKKMLHSFGDGCRFEAGPIKTPLRALEKVVRRSFHIFL